MDVARLAVAISLGALAGCGASAGVLVTRPARDCHMRGSGLFALPDPHCTPGAVNPEVTQANIGATICRYGYADSIRPPESVTEPLKRASMAAYGDTGSPRAYEYDHLIPLELGGAPTDTRNLWPEPGATPNPKDTLENRLRALVCSSRLSLASAQSMIARDWVAAWRQYR